MTLHFILNTPALFTAVEGIAGCKNLRNYLGRIHRTTAGTDQEIDWHDDAVDYRTIGLGINLTTQPYSGGRFMIRDPRKQVRRQIGQLPAGDAFLFLLGPDWQHRLTPVESGTRTVAFGWFRTQPDWRAVALSGMRSEPVEPKTGVRQ